MKGIKAVATFYLCELHNEFSECWNHMIPTNHFNWIWLIHYWPWQWCCDTDGSGDDRIKIFKLIHTDCIPCPDLIQPLNRKLIFYNEIPLNETQAVRIIDRRAWTHTHSATLWKLSPRKCFNLLCLFLRNSITCLQSQDSLLLIFLNRT